MKISIKDAKIIMRFVAKDFICIMKYLIIATAIIAMVALVILVVPLKYLEFAFLLFCFLVILGFRYYEKLIEYKKENGFDK